MSSAEGTVERTVEKTEEGTAQETVEGSAEGTEEGSAEGTMGGSALSAAARARMERNRLRARALQDARLVSTDKVAAAAGGAAGGWAARDSGGGFLLEEEAAPARRDAEAAWRQGGAAPPARCDLCACTFPRSFLLEHFDLSVCDQCRDEEAHALVTRTDAKAEFLLQDCDLDGRPPPLRCLVRRNPHARARSDMRLYLRDQVRARALEVWGGEAGLAAERERREGARAARQETRRRRELRALRRAVRADLRPRAAAPHAHHWGPERALAPDHYQRACLTCGHTETYEKM